MCQKFFVNAVHNVFAVILLLFFVVGYGSSSIAQEDLDPIVTDFQFYYDDLTQQKLSRVYWALGAYDVRDNNLVDNYMKINECDIFKAYNFNEFEWKSIRNKARNFLSTEGDKFSTRFKFVQPLLLSEYDSKKQEFLIHPDYQISNSSRFEVRVQDPNSVPCSDNQRGIQGYPTSMLVTFSRPFTLTSIPMGPERARRYAEKKNAVYYEQNGRNMKRGHVYMYRDAYVIFKIRFFDFRGTSARLGSGQRDANFNAVLEGYEIYEDNQHSELLSFQNYLRSDEDRRKKSMQLMQEYEEMKKRRGSGRY